MQQTDIQMILCDVDGTLLQKNECMISEAVFHAIKTATQNGVKFIIASGRSHLDLYRLFSPVADLVYFVAGDGGITIKNNRVISHSYISAELIENLLKILGTETETGCLCYSSEGVYSLGHVPKARVYHPVNSFAEINGGIYKIAFYNPSNFIRYKLKDFSRRSLKLSEVYEDTTWMEFVAAGTDKGSACKNIQQLENVPIEQTAAFGDNTNDFGMLRRARITYASASAIPQIKRMCKFMANHIDQEIIKLSRERSSL